MSIDQDDLRTKKRRIAGEFRRTIRRLIADMEDPTKDVTEEESEQPSKKLIDGQKSPNERTNELLDVPIREDPKGVERLV